jgi:hypothetical protein
MLLIVGNQLGRRVVPGVKSTMGEGDRSSVFYHVMTKINDGGRGG